MTDLNLNRMILISLADLKVALGTKTRLRLGNLLMPTCSARASSVTLLRHCLLAYSNAQKGHGFWNDPSDWFV